MINKSGNILEEGKNPNSKNGDIFNVLHVSNEEKLEILEGLSTGDIILYISHKSNDSQNQENFYLACLYMRNKISKNNNLYTEIIHLFDSQSAEGQIEINKILYSVFTYSSPRYFNKDFIDSFALPQTEETIDFFEALKENSKNQFIFFALNSTVKSYIDISTSENNFSTIASKNYDKYKIKGKHIHIKGHQFGSILQLCKDYLIYSERDTAKGLVKINPEIHNIDEDEILKNHVYFIYDELLDQYIHHELGEKDFRKYSNYKNDTLEISNSFPLHEYSNKIIAKILIFIKENGEKSIQKLEYIFAQIFGDTHSEEIYNSFLNIFEYLNIDLDNNEKKDQQLLESFRLFRDDKIDNTEIKTLLDIFAGYIEKSEIQKISDPRIGLELDSYEKCIENETTIFHNHFPSQKSAQYMKTIHTPKMFHELNEKITFSHLDNIHTYGEIDTDLGVDITQLLFSNQIYLFHFLWSKTPEEYVDFKKILDKQEDKISFLNTFLACSKTPEIGEKILELAQYNESANIFKAYSDLINLQAEVDIKDFSSIDFLKVLLSRGEKLLLEALDKGKKGKKIEINSRYSKELIQSGAFIKVLIKSQKEGTPLSKFDFNKESPDFQVDIVQQDLFQGKSEIDIFDEEKYKNPAIFSQNDMTNIIDWSNEAYKEDKNQQIFIRSNIIETFKNPDTNHLFFRDKKDKKIIGYCKTQGDYFGSLYIHPDFIGDFGIGDMLQKMLIRESCNQSKPIQASAFIGNKILERHINYLQGVGKEVAYTPNEIAYLKFEWNSQIETYGSEINVNFSNKEELIGLLEKYFQKGYILTNIQQGNESGNITLKQTKES